MILLKEDIRRMVALGYEANEFTYFDGKYYRLRNVNGHCYFYDPVTGLCKIYRYRPLGCRIYPIIWVEGIGPTVDKSCPLAHEVTPKEFRVGVKLLKVFLRKLKEDY